MEMDSDFAATAEEALQTAGCLVLVALQNYQILSLRRVKGQVGDRVIAGNKRRIVQFAFKILRVLAEYNSVAQARGLSREVHLDSCILPRVGDKKYFGFTYLEQRPIAAFTGRPVNIKSRSRPSRGRTSYICPGHAFEENCPRPSRNGPVIRHPPRRP
jgi:hypothetical protein